MAITEQWMPSPNYSASRGPYNVIALHTTEGAMDITSLGNWFAQSSAQCSSHHGADNRGSVFGAYVREDHKAWTQASANPWCLSLEMCAYAKWSGDYWLSTQQQLLRNAADWIAYLAGKYGIPITPLTDSQAQSGTARGVCQHVNFGSMGSGHSDCGSGFPMAQVLDWARAGGTTPAEEDNGMSASVKIWQGQRYYACVWSNGNVNYRGPDTGGKWQATDPNSNAKSGAAIDIGEDGTVVITYTNQSGHVCTYTRQPGGGSWGWADLGGDARLQHPFEHHGEHESVAHLPVRVVDDVVPGVAERLVVVSVEVDEHDVTVPGLVAQFQEQVQLMEPDGLGVQREVDPPPGCNVAELIAGPQ